MLDYIFFDTALAGKFKDYLIKVNIEFQTEADNNFGSVQGEIVSIPDETSDKVLNELQVFYDELEEKMGQILDETG